MKTRLILSAITLFLDGIAQGTFILHQSDMLSAMYPMHTEPIKTNE